MSNIKSPKKLIEVALPLDDINEAAKREKSMRHGHPQTLHLWWARRPLAAARAILFAQLVNDPGGERGYYAGKTKAQADIEREELFDIIRELVKWENLNNEEVLEKARKIIRDSWKETCDLNKGKQGFDPDKLPSFHDPFAGGGAIPLEAQRLGLESYASDLNPVAVMINKAMIEIPPKFTDQKPIGPIPQGEKDKPKLHEEWQGVEGLAEDVRRYSQLFWKLSYKELSHLYPKIEITDAIVQERPDLKEYKGKQLTVIAYLWARSVKSPNPAFHDKYVPLISTFILSAKKGKEAYLEPIVEGDSYRFKVKTGKPDNWEKIKKGLKLSRGANFKCILSGSPIESSYVKSEGMAGRLKQKMLAVVLEGERRRIYLEANETIEKCAYMEKPTWKPSNELIGKSADQLPLYGLKTYADIFTDRQLRTLECLTDKLQEIYRYIKQDIEKHKSIPAEYADAICVYLAFQIDQLTNHLSTVCAWHVNNEQLKNTFSRQAIAMTWDFAETNPFSSSSGSLKNLQERQVKGILSLPGTISGYAEQANATTQNISKDKIISMDPPYYDNIMYADLSDYFYIWMKKSLKFIYPNLFSTLAAPKSDELVASIYRHKNKKEADVFFLNNMSLAIKNIATQANDTFPITIYYAFKQSDTKDSGTTSSGWETFISAVINADLMITGTWPLNTEQTKAIKTGMNVLASSVILVCRKRDKNAETISRREFQRELKEEMPEALEAMIGGREGASPIAPVDLAQAAIGPGMAIYSKYAAVLNQDGTQMSVHDALIMINKAIDEYFSDAEGELDEDSRFCVDWFMQYGFGKGVFGEADTLARAKGTSVDLVQEAGVIESGQGKVRLLKWEEYPEDWDPIKDNRTPVWEACHHMIRELNQQGERAAGALLARMPERTEPIRQLAYRLYTLCERKGWAEEARAYNELIGSWHAIVEASYEVGRKGEQKSLF